jgi:hypothetical protein
MVVGAAAAGELRTSVKYVAQAVVFLDAGRAQGVEPGAGGEIRRQGQVVARIEVVFIAENSASAKILEVLGEIRPGDEVVLTVTGAQPPEPAAVEPATEPAAPATAPPPLPTRREPINRLTGSVGLEYYVQDDLSEYNGDFRQPSVSLRARMENIRGSRHSLQVRLRARRIFRNSAAVADRSDWESRIYEAALVFDPPEGRYHYRLGRMSVARVPGAGYLDGLMVNYWPQEGLAVGAFAGAEPDLRRAYPVDGSRKAGLFAAVEGGATSGRHYDASLALAGEYRRGEINREFLSQQMDLSLHRHASVYESMELQLNRGWRRSAGDDPWQLSALHLGVRFAPLAGLTTTVGYDRYEPTRDLDNRDIADALFDESVRQGWRIGLNTRLPGGVTATAGGSVRTRHSDSDARSANFSLASPQLAPRRLTARASFNLFSGGLTSGRQQMIALRQSPLDNLDCELAVGQDRSRLESVPGRQTTNWLTVGADAYPTRSLRTSIRLDLNRGGGVDSRRWQFEVTGRF